MKSLKSDNMLKILSLIIAIGLWFYVVQVQNPEREETFKDIPVVFTQTAELENKDLILLNDKDRTIDVTVRGNMKRILNISAEEITVVAELGSIEEKGKHTVVANVVLPYGNLEIVKKNPSVVSVEVDDLITKTFEISTSAMGTPKEGFVAGETIATPSEILVTGAKTIVDGISSVVATVDVSGKDTDIATVTVPKAFDSNNKEINHNHISFDTEEIQVRCEMLKTKTVSLIPVLSSDLKTDEYYYQPDKNALSKINIKGPADIVDTLLAVRTKPISVRDINESGDAEISLNLPDRVSSLDGDTFIIRFNKTLVPKQDTNE